MQKQTKREKTVAVQEKMLESVKGGSGFVGSSGHTIGDPNTPDEGPH